MKYFGILDREELKEELKIIEIESSKESCKDFELEFSQETIDMCRQLDIEHLLVEKDIFKYTFLSDKMIDYENDPTNFKGELTFEDFDAFLDIPILISYKVYDLIYELYIFKVEKLKLDFFDLFEENIYGMTYQEARKVALIHFKELYNTITLSNPEQSFTMRNSKYEKIIHTPSLLYKLDREKKHIINNINIYTYLPYLYGDISLFNVSPYYNEDLINEITFFQIKVDVLLELNNRFNFETDIYFNNIFYYQIESIVYLDSFLNSGAYAFTMYTIGNIDNFKRSTLESLLQFLKESKLFNSTAENFMEIVNLKFDENIKTLKKHPEMRGETTHKIRMNNFQKEWEIFKAKYFPED
jgi:hypothetical protein